MKSLFRFDQKAFTLLELLVVIAIIGMITAASVVPYTNFVKKSRDARRKVDLEQMRAALELYKSNNEEGLYPQESELQTELVPNYIKEIPEDPQGGEYDYACVDACKDYTLRAELESGQIYVAAAGGTSTYTPTGGPTVAPTYSIPTNSPLPTTIACRQNGTSCTYNSDCCSNYCSTVATEVLGAATSRSKGVATLLAADEIGVQKYCAANPNPTLAPSATIQPTATAIPPTPIPCPNGGTLRCTSYGCRCEHTSCVNNTCTYVFGDSPDQCVINSSCGYSSN